MTDDRVEFLCWAAGVEDGGGVVDGGGGAGRFFRTVVLDCDGLIPLTEAEEALLTDPLVTLDSACFICDSHRVRIARMASPSMSLSWETDSESSSPYLRLRVIGSMSIIVLLLIESSDMGLMKAKLCVLSESLLPRSAIPLPLEPILTIPPGARRPITGLFSTLCERLAEPTATTELTGWCRFDRDELIWLDLRNHRANIFDMPPVSLMT